MRGIGYGAGNGNGYRFRIAVWKEVSEASVPHYVYTTYRLTAVWVNTGLTQKPNPVA